MKKWELIAGAKRLSHLPMMPLPVGAIDETVTNYSLRDLLQEQRRVTIDPVTSKRQIPSAEKRATPTVHPPS
jgi:hypothetical protein